MQSPQKIALGAIALFFILTALAVIISVRNAPPRIIEHKACSAEAMLCPDGSYVSRSGPNCEFAPCPPSMPPPIPGEIKPVVPTPKPAPTPIGGGDKGVACTMDAKQCPDGSYVGRISPDCKFALCPTPEPTPSPISGTSGSCTSDSDCAAGYSCEDISPVVREGTQNLQCWKNGSPRPICLSGETHIATPYGDMLVRDAYAGAIVFSVDQNGKKIAVPLRLAAKTHAPKDHQVVHLRLADGRELFVSPGHQVADGRTAGSLEAGDTLDHSQVTRAQLIPYTESYTYDILPEGETGLYFGNGILLQSTLKNQEPIK